MKFTNVCEDQSFFTDIDIKNKLNDTETYMMMICKEYNINYDTMDAYPIHIVSEGIIGKIVSFIKMIFQKAIQLLVKLWKWIVGFVKFIWNSIKKFINKLLGRNKKSSDKKVKSQFISLEAAFINEKDISSRDELIKQYKNTINSISSKINKFSKENIDYMKKFENAVNKNIIGNENYVPIEEKVIYNNTKMRLGLRDKEFANYMNTTYGDTVRQYEPTTYFDDDDFALGPKGSIGYDAVIQGKNKIDHIAIFDPEVYNMEKLKLIKEADDIVEAYNLFTKKEILRLAESHGDLSKAQELISKVAGNTVQVAIGYSFKTFKEIGIPEEDIFRYLQNSSFPVFEGDKDEVTKQLRQWVQLKINYNKGLISCLQKALIVNHKLFNLGLSDAEFMTEEIDKGNYKQVAQLIKANINKFKPDNAEDYGVYDFRSIGLGCLIISAVARITTPRLCDAMISADGELTYAGFNYITKYDVTVLAHGHDNWVNWEIDPVTSLSGSKLYNDATDLIRALIKDGCKRINLLSCNQSHHNLPEDLRKNKKVLIKMSTEETLI